jgi:RimJ/RimL family protein N-acetyltransferase
VQLHAWSGNDRAIRCFERVGFRREGLHRRRWCKGDEWRDEVTMAILCDEYQRLWGAEGRTPRQER